MTTADVHRLVRLQRDHQAWSLLRADNAAVVLALLARHFDHGTRRLPAPELFELLDTDLQELRDEGFDLPRTGQAYCADWVRAGYLLRRPSTDSREETLEPTESTFAALAFVSGLTSTTSSVTESRLTTLSSQLQALARDSDPRSESRLAALRAERDALDRQIAAVESGDFPVLDGTRAAERAKEILALAGEIPGDFARVRAELDSLNRELRARILDDEGDRGDTLGEVFRGVDLIGNSDAGRSFTGFYDMIIDPERSSQLDAWIEVVLQRSFAQLLDLAERRRFRSLLTEMETSGSEVHATMTSLSRSLRHFVQSRHYEEHRRLQRLLRSAQQQALEVARRRKPYDLLDLELVRIGMSIDSVAALQLHNPADDLVAEPVVSQPAGEVDLDELRRIVRESEIDLDELAGNVAATLGARGRATIGDVLQDHPATQGLASAVGLLVLAAEHGHPMDGTEDISWTSPRGNVRIASIRRYLFDPTDAAFALPQEDA
ncbi:DUF3375 domain-containing protein [Rhodococcus sp. NPDC003382]|uniref:DUF3375 domain-containing protein n=1 Tax=unclassified Rhodococcus (in: high G+C Gram-positive bacteria) TaxID=192944 RepID=UPI0018CF5889|nr:MULTISPECIES: DUF3375 domain-containing protein [unclassified Rhodococcus (in: high G+C Gram-positive bacteria)]MBH0119473.1 DUF3375 domain-containing protein [Rhodococcus sp. CX]MCK8673039.1 DUF3375 domain-containing protein [Rhodococcus sp. HM1]